MAVEVYFWPPKGSNIGHAAIMVDGGAPRGKMYLSAWPGSLLSVIVAGAGTFNQYSDDVAAEGGPPQVVRLTKLDETAIKAQVEKCRRGAVYSFPGFNCASQASICLNAGLPTATLQWALDMIGGPTSYPFRTSKIDTPWTLFVYAKSLTLNYA